MRRGWCGPHSSLYWLVYSLLFQAFGQGILVFLLSFSMPIQNDTLAKRESPHGSKTKFFFKNNKVNLGSSSTFRRVYWLQSMHHYFFTTSCRLSSIIFSYFRYVCHLTSHNVKWVKIKAYGCICFHDYVIMNWYFKYYPVTNSPYTSLTSPYTSLFFISNSTLLIYEREYFVFRKSWKIWKIKIMKHHQPFVSPPAAY